jgi:hypothetical protein
LKLNGVAPESKQLELATVAEGPQLGNLQPIDVGPIAAVDSYTKWEPRPLPDPRQSKTAELVEGLVDIVAVEAPIVSSFAYQRFARAAGVQRITKGAIAPLNKAMKAAVEKGLLLDTNEWEERALERRILRVCGSPRALIRPLGDREFEDVPPSELAALLTHFAETAPGRPPDDLFRDVVMHFGLRRLTERIRTQLRWVHDRIGTLLGEFAE